MTVVGPLASISSCTTALLRTTVPTRVSLSCSAGGAFGRRLELGVGVGAPGDGLPDVEVQGVGGTHGHHDLVGPRGVGHPSLQDRDPVLVEVEPVDASVDVEVGLLGRCRRLPVRSDRLAVDGRVALGPPDVG